MSTEQAIDVVREGVELADEHGEGRILLCGDEAEVLDALEEEFGIDENGGVLTEEDLARIRGESPTALD